MPYPSNAEVICESSLSPLLEDGSPELLERGGELLGGDGDDAVQVHRVLRDLNLDEVDGEGAAVLVLSLPHVANKVDGFQVIFE